MHDDTRAPAGAPKSSTAIQDQELRLARHEQLMATTFSREEVEGFYARFDELVPPMPLHCFASG